MALPHRRQQLARFILFHELTGEKVAFALGCSVTRVRNLSQGHVYASPDEIAALERLFGLPVEVLLEPDLLIYRENWPPPRGFNLGKALAEAKAETEIERLRKKVGE